MCEGHGIPRPDMGCRDATDPSGDKHHTHDFSAEERIRPSRNLTTAPPNRMGRLASVDALRGLVVLLLVPDLFGGFSFHQMAKRHPEDPLWKALAQQFTHVDWTGVSIWDLVMPAFVFLVGVSLGLSYAARRTSTSERSFLRHAALRSAALVVLGVLLARGTLGRIDELMPLLVLTIGLPLGRWLHRLTGGEWSHSRFDAIYSVCVLVVAAAWIVIAPARYDDFELDQILILIGLAYFPAAWLQRERVATQLLVAAGILATYGIAFIAYTPPAHLLPQGEVLTGIFAHWNNDNNVAAAFDRWLLNLWPRPRPYTGNFHGYHTLQFVPLIAVILAGACTGRLAAQRGSLRALAPKLAAAATCGLVASWLLTVTLFPLVKSLWTPSWTLFSTALILLLLAGFSLLFDADGRRWLAQPLVVLGTNALLLYVLSYNERWRVLLLWQRLLGEHLPTVSWQPVLDAGLILAGFWLLAAVLHRLGLFVRL